MKIEVGKSYINAKGDIRYINGYIPTDIFPYKSSSGDSFSKDGLFRVITKLCKDDLICEVVPEIYEEYKSSLNYSLKDFLIAHYEYYSGKKYEQTNL